MSDSLQLLDCRPPGSSVHGILQARILVLGIVLCSVDTTVNKIGNVSASYSSISGVYISCKIHWDRIMDSRKSWKAKSFNNVSHFIVMKNEVKCICDLAS